MNAEETQRSRMPIPWPAVIAFIILAGLNLIAIETSSDSFFRNAIISILCSLATAATGAFGYAFSELLITQREMRVDLERRRTFLDEQHMKIVKDRTGKGESP